MPNIWMDVDAALAEVPVNILALIDDTDFKSREVAVAWNQAGMDLVWNFVTTAGAMSQTAVTPTTGGAYDWAHQGDGMYSIEIPASGGGDINNDTEGFGWFTGFCTGVLPWRGPVIGFRAAAINDALIDGATLIVASVSGAVGSVTGAVGSVTGAVGSVAGNVDGSTASVSGAVGSVTGAVGSVAGNVDGSVASVAGAVGSVAGNVDGSVASVTAGVTLANDAIKLITFDESTAWPLVAADSGSTQVARVGADGDTLEILSDEIAALNDPTAVTIADAVLDEAKGAHTGLLAKALPDAAPDAAGGLPISDAGGLDFDALNAAAVRLTAVRAAVLTDWIDAGRLDAILDTIATDAARLTAGRAAILTDWIDGGRLDLLIDALGTAISALNDIAVTDITQRQIPDSVPADGTRPTIEQAIYMTLQLLVERAVVDTTVMVKKVDGSTTLFTLTLDDASDPTSITRAT